MRALYRLSCLLLSAGTGACGGPPPASVPSVPAAPPAKVEGPKLEDRGWGVMRSKTLGLKLALPEARSWLEPAGADVRVGHAGRAGWELRHDSASRNGCPDSVITVVARLCEPESSSA